MRLLAYMKDNKLDDEAMAALVGEDTTARAVRKWKYGETTPPLSKVLKIQEITKGQVEPTDFLPAPENPASPSTQPDASDLAANDVEGCK